MNDIVNDKKGHNIVNEKIVTLLLSQTAYLCVYDAIQSYFHIVSVALGKKMQKAFAP